MKRICVVIDSRAEYGHLFWLMKEIEKDPALELQLVVAGVHSLSASFEQFIKRVEQDFRIARRIGVALENDSRLSTTKAMGELIKELGGAFQKLKPDWAVLLGDRFEMLAAAEAALVARVPIAHIHGGESTEGAFDESIRHAITKMAFLHFTAAAPYRERVIQMGESPDRVFCFGAPVLDHLERMSPLSRQDIERRLDFNFGKINFLVTFHPVTLEEASSERQMKELLLALEAFPEARVIFTYPNADPDNSGIRRLLKRYARKHRGRVLLAASLGERLYLSLLPFMDAMIGNSSSGIIEMPAFRKPTVNIGDRQRGRLMAESIISCEPRARAIVRATRRALGSDFKNTVERGTPVYRGGNVSEQIKNMLRDFDLSADALKKSFYVPGVLKKTTPAIVIAEAGVNHNGSLSLAKKLVEAAVEAGADIVKFQTFKADRLVHENTPKAEYQKKATGNTTQTQFQMLKKLELSFTMHRELIDVCRKKGIGFLSSPFDEESVDFLASLGVGALKIPSGEITHAPFLLRAARTGLPLILSTGMATLDEIEAALGVIAFGLVRKGGRGPSVTAFREAFMSREGQSLLKKKATLLHCVTQYPTPPDQMNLLAMDVLRERFGMRVGLSDHTSGIAVPVAAVARGAVVIEKHLTLNRRMSGPDHAASLEPKAFREMVLAIRQAERAMGDRVKAPVRCEIGNRFLVRKSLRAAWAIRRGETFNPKNMTAMRPDDGPSPMRYWDFLGKKANRDFAKGEILC